MYFFLYLPIYELNMMTFEQTRPLFIKTVIFSYSFIYVKRYGVKRTCQQTCPTP